MTAPINFITAPEIASKYKGDIGISVAIKAAIVDYPRLTDPVDKAATTLLITQYDNIFTFESKAIEEDLKYVRDYFKSKFSLDVVNDMIYVIKDNDKVTERLQEIANMNK